MNRARAESKLAQPSMGSDGGFSMKFAKWILKQGQCNGSAVVSPFPVYQMDRMSTESRSAGNVRRVGKRGADKILGLLGPENQDQQRQIRALLEQSVQRNDEDSDLDEEDSEFEEQPQRNPDRHSRPLTPPRGLRETPPPRLNVQPRPVPAMPPDDFQGFGCAYRSSRDEVYKPAISSGYFAGPTQYSQFSQRRENFRSSHQPQQHRVNYYYNPAFSYNCFEHPAISSRPMFSSPWQTPCCSPSQLSPCGPSRDHGSFAKGYQELARNSRVRSTDDFAFPEPQSPFRSPRSPYQSYCQSPVAGLPDVVLCERIGSGSYAVVYKGQYRQSGQYVAVKVPHDEERISTKEVSVLSRIDHPHIVKYLGTTNLVDGRFCILLELMKCSLASVIKDNGLDESSIRVYTRQILCGLAYLHSKNIVHRDIKCGNILLDSHGRAKLADFGLAKKIDYSVAKSCIGTVFYMAPEVLLTSGKVQYGLPADIWSLGCTVIEMAVGKPPWSGFAMMPFCERMRQGERPPIPAGLSFEAVNFIRSCLIWDPKQRPTAAKLLQHPFVHISSTSIFSTASPRAGELNLRKALD